MQEQKIFHSGRLRGNIHKPATYHHAIVGFMAEQLSVWSGELEDGKMKCETELTEHLCRHLDEEARHSNEWSNIRFEKENRDSHCAGRHIDLMPYPSGLNSDSRMFIGTRGYSKDEMLFPIECKRLPTPRRNPAEPKEYVITEKKTTGGIQRFKFGYHGADYTFGAMIAYVQKDSFTHWHRTVNGWIDELGNVQGYPWDSSEALERDKRKSPNRLCQLRSKHARTDSLDDIELHHLWVNVS